MKMIFPKEKQKKGLCHRSLWHHARSTGTFKAKSLFQIHFPTAQGAHIPHHLQQDGFRQPEAPSSPSMGTLWLWHSSSQLGTSCSSRGAHDFLVDLRMPLLLFSWLPGRLSDSRDFSAILRWFKRYTPVRPGGLRFGLGAGRGRRPERSQLNTWIQALSLREPGSPARTELPVSMQWDGPLSTRGSWIPVTNVA